MKAKRRELSSRSSLPGGFFPGRRQDSACNNGHDKGDVPADFAHAGRCASSVSVIGEAAASISAEFQKAVEGCMAGGVAISGNLVVHQYWQVDLDRVWGIVKKDLARTRAEAQAGWGGSR